MDTLSVMTGLFTDLFVAWSPFLVPILFVWFAIWYVTRPVKEKK